MSRLPPILPLPPEIPPGESARVTLRDTFAAAALTGLLVHSNDDADEPNTPSDVAYTAYEMADAMLRVRGSRTATTTDLDAGPAATAPSSGNDGPSPDSHGTGSTPVTEPMPAFVSGSGSVTPVSYAESTEKRVDWHTIREPLAAGGRVACGQAEAATPDSPSLSCAISPVTDGRPAPTAEPAAWGVVDDRGLQLALHPTPEHASSMARNFGIGLAEVVPLYRKRQPTLTDAEREAIHWVVGDVADITGPVEETLRGLLERTK